MVDENGLVTAGSTAGVATITACTVDGGFTASCVIKTGPHATDLYISDSQILLVPGFTHALTATVMPLKAVYKDVNWASTNEAVASVDENGVVTAHKSGTAIVIAETDDGSIAKTCQVTVNNSTKGFELSSKAEYIGVDASVQLKGVFIPENAENKAVIWTTSDSTIATVDENGLVTGKKAGSVVITATTIDGGHKDYCIVRVVGITGSYANTVVDAENGCIYGLGVGMDSLDDYVVLTDNSCALEYDSLTNELGTGTVANIVRDGEIVDSYTVVIFGDVNGDGWYDGEDAFLVNLIAKGMLDRDDVGEAIWTAADCNHDGEINEADVDLLTGAGLKLNNVDQSKTVAELATNSDYIEYVMLIDQSTGMNPDITPDVDDIQQGTTDTNTTPEQPADEINIEAIITFIFDLIEKLINFIFSFVIK